MSGPLTVGITGAARGIGLETARLLAARGHRVEIGDLDGELAAAAAAGIGPAARGGPLDVTDRDGFAGWLAGIEAERGPLDVLINNAGIAPTAPRSAAQDPAILRATIEVDLIGVINGTLEAIRLMEPRRRGQIINVSSLAGLVGVPGLAAYAAAKHGVVGFTESVRAEYRDAGIQLTLVLPGPAATRMMDGTRRSPAVKLTPAATVAARIADAVGTRRDRLTHPRFDGLFSRLAGALPPAAGRRLSRLVGADRIYTEVDPAARSGYERWLRGDGR